MIERYFGTEEDDKAIAPQVDENAQQFHFGVPDGAASTQSDNFEF